MSRHDFLFSILLGILWLCRFLFFIGVQKPTAIISSTLPSIPRVSKPWATGQIWPTACFVSKVLFEHSHARSFACFLWLLSCAMAELNGCNEDYTAAKPTYLQNRSASPAYGGWLRSSVAFDGQFLLGYSAKGNLWAWVQSGSVSNSASGWRARLSKFMLKDNDSSEKVTLRQHLDKKNEFTIEPASWSRQKRGVEGGSAR